MPSHEAQSDAEALGGLRGYTDGESSPIVHQAATMGFPDMTNCGSISRRPGRDQDGMAYPPQSQASGILTTDSLRRMGAAKRAKRSEAVWEYSDSWAAGLFDGAGSISLVNRSEAVRSGEYRLVVQLSTLARRRSVLDELKRVFGGAILEKPDGSWKWQLSAISATRFLKAIRDHTLSRRAEIDAILELRALVGGPGTKISEADRVAREAGFEKWRLSR